MPKKKIFCCCLFCVIILLLPGCSGNLSEPMAESQQIKKRVDEHLAVDINYNSKVNNYYNIKLDKKTYSDESICDVFLKDKKFEKQLWTDGIGKTFTSGNYELRTVGNLFDYVNSAVCENYFLLVRKDNAAIPGVLRTDLKEFFNLAKLTDLDYDSSKKLNDNYIESLGISCSLSEYYALDIKGLNLLERYILPDENYNELKENGSLPNGRFREWKKDQEAYVFVSQVTFDDTPIHSISYSVDGQIRETDFGCVWSIIGKDGLISFSSGNIPGKEIERTDVTLINMNDALLQVIKMYQNRLFTTDVCINQVDLMYIPIENSATEITLMPAWRFQTVIKGSNNTLETSDNYNSQDIIEYTIINATTGEVLN